MCSVCSLILKPCNQNEKDGLAKNINELWEFCETLMQEWQKNGERVLKDRQQRWIGIERMIKEWSKRCLI